MNAYILYLLIGAVIMLQIIWRWFTDKKIAFTTECFVFILWLVFSTILLGQYVHSTTYCGISGGTLEQGVGKDGNTHISYKCFNGESYITKINCDDSEYGFCDNRKEVLVK